MNLIIPIVAIVGALLAIMCAAPLSARVRQRLVRASVIIGWLGVLTGAAGIYAGELAGLGSLLGVAACGGLAVLPLGMKLEAARDFAAPVGALIPLVAGVLGVVLPSDIAGGNAAQFLLYAGHWGTFGAALVSALIAAALASSEGWTSPNRPKSPGLSVGLALAALPAGAYLLGVLRPGPDGAGWSLPLASSAGPVTWQIEPSAQFTTGLGIEAVVELGWVGPMLLAAAVVALATGVATRFGAGPRASAFGWFVSAAAALSGVLGVVTRRTAVSLPDASAYEQSARNLLSEVEGSQALIEQGLLDQGKFVTEGDLFVPLGAVAPELAMLAVACLLGLLAGVFALRKGWPAGAGKDPRRVAMRLYARDFSIRAIMLVWLSWLLVTLIHWTHYGAVGVGSAAEWSAVGVLMIATGAVLLGWSRRTSQVDRIVREVVPGLVFALFVIGLAVSLVFDAPFGLSIVF